MKDKLMEGVLVFAEKLQTNKYMSAIKNAFTDLLPIIICGAFCILIRFVVLSTTTKGLSVAKLPGMAWLEQLNPIFVAASYATMDFFAVGLVFLIAIELGKSYDMKNDMILPFVAVASFVALCGSSDAGFGISGIVKSTTGEEVKYAVNGVLASKFTGSQGLFIAMISAVLATEIYVKLVKSGKLEIRMPEQVPSNVSRSFNVLFPAVFTILIVAALGFAFRMVFGYSLYEAIAKWIQAPLTGLLTGLPGYLFIFWCTTFLWCFGIHGSNVLGPVYKATLLIAIQENQKAVEMGQKAVNILNESFSNCFSIQTGAGITGGLIIAILLLSKRDDYKAIAKLSVAPGIFNINETMTFGLPIVLNPLIVVPFMLAPIASAVFAYVLTAIGFCPILVYNVPWTTPPMLGAFIASGGSINAAITQGLTLVVSALIYAPFVLVANKQVANEA